MWILVALLIVALYLFVQSVGDISNMVALYYLACSQSAYDKSNIRGEAAIILFEKNRHTAIKL
jgi:hypothetical protein